MRWAATDHERGTTFAGEGDDRAHERTLDGAVPLAEHLIDVPVQLARRVRVDALRPKLGADGLCSTVREHARRSPAVAARVALIGDARRVVLGEPDFGRIRGCLPTEDTGILSHVGLILKK